MSNKKLKKDRSQQGSVVIEFALLISVLVLLVVGVVDFSLAITQGMMLSAAASAGAHYGATEGYFYSSTNMASAASGAAPGLTNMTVTVNVYCSCSAGGTAYTCSDTLCSTYELPRQYVTVNTSAPIPMFIPFPGIPQSITMYGTASLRIR